MKKLVSLFAAMMLCLVLGTTALAAANDYTFTLETDGSAVVGDTITVKLQLSQNGGGSFDLYAMQDYVRFDTEYFSYVDNSLSVYSVQNGEQKRDVFSATALDFDEDGVIDRVFVNRAGTSAETLASGVQVMEFKLKVKTQGSTALTQSGMEIFKDPANPYRYTAGNANVTLRAAGGTDPAPTPTPDPSNPPIVTIQPTQNGSVSFQPKQPKAGESVTLVVAPKNGYQLSQICASTASGAVLPLTDMGNGTYRFTMPSESVTVWATFAEEGQSAVRFVDVKPTDYFYDAVQWAVERGVTKGLSNDRFGPEAPCTRAQIVTFLWRAAGSPMPKSLVNPFTDVTSSDYYYYAVLWAVENGVTKGTGATAFSPDATCTRGQAVTFLCRAVGTENVTGSSFVDVPNDAFYAGAVSWAVTNGVTNGTSATTFSPDTECTRGQIVTFLYRAYQGK